MNEQQMRGAPSPGLDAAYSLETPDDNRKLYADWASTYDDGFIAAEGYVYPRFVAAALAESGGRGPVLDVGCGTGACGVELATLGIGPVDGVDISAEMLEVAATKRVGGAAVYRRLVAADLTAGLDTEDDTYCAVVSVGTFTHGHLGPEVLSELIRVSMPGATLAIGINAEHFDRRAFGEVFDDMEAEGEIGSVELLDVPIYEANTSAHGADRALIARCVRSG